MISTLKVQTLEKEPLIEKIKAEIKKRAEAKAKLALLKRPKRMAKHYGWSISSSVPLASLKSVLSSRQSSRCPAVCPPCLK